MKTSMQPKITTDSAFIGRHRTLSKWDAIYIVIWIFVVTGNTLTLVVIGKTRKLRTIPNAILASLAVCDILVAIQTAMVVVFVGNRSATTDELIQYCIFTFVTYLQPLQCSIYHLLLITGERFVAISRPLRYIQLITKRRVAIAIAVAWIVSLANTTLPVYIGGIHGVPNLSCSPASYLTQGQIVYAMSAVPIAAIVISSVNVIIYRIVRAHQARIKNQKMIDSRRNFLEDARTAGAVAITSLVFLVFWLPFYIEMTLKTMPGADVNLSYIPAFVAILNSAANPVIYVIRLKSFRKAALDMFMCKKQTAAVSTITK